jgi:hypothetical protein
MPGDSPHLNNKAARQNGYNAIIVGSGISGGWAAKELCEKEIKGAHAGKRRRCR